MQKILKFLKSNILTILLAIIPPIAIWYYFQRDTKNLEIEILANVSVVSIEEKYSEGIEINYNKNLISSLSVVDARVKNSGNQPLERADFDVPLYLKYYGEIISPVQIIDSKPSDLPISFKVSNDSIIINPLLLNSGDYFTLRARIANIKNNSLPIKANSRIKGVKNIEVVKAEKVDTPLWLNYLLGALAAIGVAISIASSIKLLRRFGRLTVSFPLGVGIELSKIENTNKTNERVSQLADQLQITSYDYKSNILLLRLKIENQLRELARDANLPPSVQLGSLTRISRILEDKGFISKNVSILIRDISPVMNRELHESESYLSEAEYEEIQRAALSIVAILETEVNNRINKKSLPNQRLNPTAE